MPSLAEPSKTVDGAADQEMGNFEGDAGSCPAEATIRMSSVGGNLLVYIVNSAGTYIQCSFNFVTFAGQ